MRSCFRNVRRLDALAIVLLAAFFFRAYIPVGFMPASGTPFLLELCPTYAGGMPAHQHQHHSPAHNDFQNCPFGSAPAQGPVSALLAFEPPGQIASALTVSLDFERPIIRPYRAHQPRGPPTPA
jgi:hypothetical protein